MQAKRNRDIPFTDKSINNAIGALSKLLQPTARATTSTATRPRVSNCDVQRPRMVNNNSNIEVRSPRVDTNNDKDVRSPRVLRPRVKISQQKSSRGIRVYRIFGEPNRLVEHRGYINDFDKKEGYHNVKYQDSDNEEYSKEKIGVMLRPTERKTNILRVLAATKHERIIEKYATMVTIYTSLSKFSGGFSKAI